MFADFHFLRPLWLLAAPPLLWLCWRLGRARADAGDWPKICDPHLLPYLLRIQPRRPDRLPLRLLGLGWLLAVVALAGPTWTREPQPLYQTPFARVIVLNLGQSMLTADVTPSRLTRARYKIDDILRRSQAGQTGLVVFAGAAFAVSPLTQDAATLAAALPALTPEVMPVGGGRVDLGLRKAGELLAQAGVVEGEALLLTDSSNGQSAVAAARSLRAEGYRVSVLAVGAEQGAPLWAADGAFVKDVQGNIVLSKLPTAALRELAQAGGGRYALLSSDDVDLNLLLAADAALGGIGRRGSQESAGWRETGPWLVVALIPLAALAFRRGWLGLLLLLLLPPPSWSFDWADVWRRPDQQAAQALRLGDYARAAELGDPMQRGVAEYRRGRYLEAAAAFAQAVGPDADYNRGNALAQAGRYQDALTAYDSALAAAPGLEDALHNRALVEALLRRSAGRSAPTRPDPAWDRSPDHSGYAPTLEAAPADRGATEPSTVLDTKRLPPMTPTPPANSPASPPPRAADDAVDRRLPLGEDPNDAPPDEARRRLEQELRRIPDDPSGLWRRKFLYQYRLGGSGKK